MPALEPERLSTKQRWRFHAVGDFDRALDASAIHADVSVRRVPLTRVPSTFREHVEDGDIVSQTPRPGTALSSDLTPPHPKVALTVYEQALDYKGKRCPYGDRAKFRDLTDAIEGHELGGATRWLELGVRGPADVDMVTLTPRQQISPAPQGNNPAVAATCAHDHMLENWTGTSSSFGLSVTNYGTGDGIRGENYSPISNYAGVYGVNYSTGPGVYGSGYGGGPGVAGYSDGRGVYGWGADGVVGESSTDNMSGVYGNNLSTGSGYGVTGRSANGFGVFAWGNDNSLLDLKGDILLQGILGEIFATGSAMDLYTNDDMYIDLDNDNNTPYSSFEILRGDDYALWTIMEPSGDVVALGSQASVMQTTDQGQRLMYSVMGTGVWLEDVGSAALGGGGEMFIAFDAVYAQAAMLTADYQVFVTAISDQPVLLYVSAKTPAGFTVKGVTLDGKPAACAFDYRVVAPRAGYEGVRTEPYVSPEKEQP